MNDQRKDLLSIGSFSKAAQLSVKALRLYEALDILTPVYVDRESGYRYYQAGQLRPARLIRMLRQVEMPLARIRQVLAAVQGEAPSEAERLVQEYWQERETRLEGGRKLIPTLIQTLRKEAVTMNLEVQVKELEPQPVLSITRRVKIEGLNEHIQNSLKEIYAFLEAQNVPAAGAPFGLYHGPVNETDDGPMEVCVPVGEELHGPEGMAAYTLPGGRAVAVVMEGVQCDFPAVLAGYDTAYDWIESNGYAEAGSPREVWHSPPGPDEKLEVVWLFREA